jgi:hypothetical protein
MIAVWIGFGLIAAGLALGSYVTARLWIEHRAAERLNDFDDEDEYPSW